KVEAFRPVVGGTVRDVDAINSKLSLELDGTRLVFANLPVAEDAQLILGGKRAGLADLKKGMRVVVELRGRVTDNVLSSPLERRIVDVREAGAEGDGRP